MVADLMAEMAEQIRNPGDRSADGARRDGTPKSDDNSSLQGWQRPHGASSANAGAGPPRRRQPRLLEHRRVLGWAATGAYPTLRITTSRNGPRGRMEPTAADALPWVQFCLVAHYQQAATIKRRNEEMGQNLGRNWRLFIRENIRLTTPRRASTSVCRARAMQQLPSLKG